MEIVTLPRRPANSQPKTREGLRAVLTELGFAWRYNVRAHRAELREDGGEWCQANDRLICDIRSQIPERFTDAGSDGDKPKPLAFGRTAWEDCFGALLHRAEVDPFREWLESHCRQWDGTKRLDSWLATVFYRAGERRSGGMVQPIPSARGRVANLPDPARSSTKCPC